MLVFHFLIPFPLKNIFNIFEPIIGVENIHALISTSSILEVQATQVTISKEEDDENKTESTSESEKLSSPHVSKETGFVNTTHITVQSNEGINQAGGVSQDTANNSQDTTNASTDNDNGKDDQDSDTAEEHIDEGLLYSSLPLGDTIPQFVLTVWQGSLS